MTVQFDFSDASARVDLEAAAQHGAPESFYRSTGKRIVDLLLIALASPIVLPVFCAIYLALRLSGHRPFFVQDRIGRNGERFAILKFRTMVEDADAALLAHLAENAEARAEWNAHQKLKRDPRVTRIGRVLRKTSLDELPQLVNVLRGDMSIVGPRPMLPEQQALYPSRAYYNLRPGITGPWQVSDRNACEFRGRARFDELYDGTLGLWTDLSIMVRTFAVMLRGTGY